MLAIILSHPLTVLLASSLAHLASTLPSPPGEKLTEVAGLFGIYTSGTILLCPTSQPQAHSAKQPEVPHDVRMLMRAPPTAATTHKAHTHPGLPLDGSGMAALLGSLAWRLHAEAGRWRVDCWNPSMFLYQAAAPPSSCYGLPAAPFSKTAFAGGEPCSQRLTGGEEGAEEEVDKSNTLALLPQGGIHVPGLPVGSSCSSISFLV